MVTTDVMHAWPLCKTYLLLRVCQHRQTHFLRQWCSFKPSYRFVRSSATSFFIWRHYCMPHKIKINYCSRFEECEGCHIRFLRLQVGVFFTSGLAKMRVRKDWWVLVDVAILRLKKEGKLGEMLRCAARRLVSPSLRGSSPMLGMFWLPFSDILG